MTTHLNVGNDYRIGTDVGPVDSGKVNALNVCSCDSDFFSSARELCIPAPFFAFKLYSLIQRGNKLRMPVDLDSRFLASGKC